MPDPCEDADHDGWYDYDSSDDFADVAEDIDFDPDDPEFYPPGHWGYDSFDDVDFDDDDDNYTLGANGAE